MNVSVKSLLVVASLITSACSSIPEKESIQVLAPPTEKTLKPKASLEVDAVLLDHRYFTVSYNRKHRLANWVIYTLEKKDLHGSGRRAKKFKADPILVKLGIQPVVHSDYTHSGYTRGHLAPAEDFSRTQEAIEATFVMSNVIPQKGPVNSGAWARLEKQVRSFACGEEKIKVVTGPILKAGLSQLPAGVSIPEEFFKLVIDETPPRKSIAFIFNQSERGQTALSKQVSLSELQKLKMLPAEELPADSKLNDWKTCQ
jgi:endonuclease G